MRGGKHVTIVGSEHHGLVVVEATYSAFASMHLIFGRTECPLSPSHDVSASLSPYLKDTPNAIIDPYTSPFHRPRLNVGLVRNWGNALWPVLSQADRLRLTGHGWLTLDVDSFALGLRFLLPPRIVLDTLDELVSASAGSDVLNAG